MKEITLIPFIISLIYSDDLLARSIRSTATKLSQETINIGGALAVAGLGIGCVMLAMGNQNASKYITGSIIGATLLFMSPSIIKFLKGIA